MSWLSPHLKRPWRPQNNSFSSPPGHQFNQGYIHQTQQHFNHQFHNQYNSPQNFSPRNSFSPRYQNNRGRPRYQQRFSGSPRSEANSTSAELTGGYRSQQGFNQDSERHNPFFHPAMMQNPWEGLEEDFDEVRDELLESAQELILTIPMTVSQWIRKKPRVEEMPCEESNADTEKSAKSIARLADTVSQIEDQLKAHQSTIEDKTAVSIKEENPESELLLPGEFQISIPNDINVKIENEEEMEENEQKMIENDKLDGTEVNEKETLSVSIDNSTPLKPAMFDRSSFSENVSNIVQSPPVLNSQPATPDRVVKPQPLQP